MPINETALYMQALGDLTSDASAGVFSSILCQQIMAQQATITQLGSSLITLLHPGLLQSENYRAETPTLYGDGFKLTSNGEAELYNCKKFTVRDAGNIALGQKRVYIDNDEILLQEYEGNYKWKTLTILNTTAGLGLVSCRGLTTSDGNWTAVGNSTFGTTAINSIAFGNGIFVAVGYSGKMAYSSDGINWTAVGNSTFGTTIIESVAFGYNKFVAVGYSGKMAYSSDGINWTAMDDPIFGTSAIHSIAFGDGIFVTAVSFASIAFSTNGGTRWTVLNNQNPVSQGTVETIAYVNGNFMAVGASGTICISSGLENWMAFGGNSTFGTTTIKSIAFGNGIYVAVGGDKMAYSSTGINWTAVDTSTIATTLLYSIAFGNGIFVVVGYSGKMAYSSDGINWTAISNSPFGGSRIYSVAFGYNRFIAADYNGKMAYCYADTIDMWQSRAGFLEKKIASTATKYKLFDGKWLNFNSGGSVNWSDS